MDQKYLPIPMADPIYILVTNFYGKICHKNVKLCTERFVILPIADTSILADIAEILIADTIIDATLTSMCD